MKDTAHTATIEELEDNQDIELDSDFYIDNPEIINLQEEGIVFTINQHYAEQKKAEEQILAFYAYT